MNTASIATRAAGLATLLALAWIDLRRMMLLVMSPDGIAVLRDAQVPFGPGPCIGRATVVAQRLLSA